MFSVGGKLDVETLNGPNGLEVYGQNGKAYSLDPAAGVDYLYTDPSNPVVRKAEPVYCNEYSSGSCLVGHELARQWTDRLWITGGLLVSDYSSTGAEKCALPVSSCPGCYTYWCGFNRKNIVFDQRLLSNPPPGFPRSELQKDIVEQWRKSYVGTADMSGNPVATVTPTPTATPDPGTGGGGEDPCAIDPDSCGGGIYGGPH